MFSYIFAGLAISVGFATFLNNQLVDKFVMYKIVFSTFLMVTKLKKY